MSIKINIRKTIFITLWSVIGVAVLVLLIAAINHRNSRTCKGYDIQITGPGNERFMNKKEIVGVLTHNGKDKLEGASLPSFNLLQLEEQVMKNPWAKKASIFFDNNELLHVNVTERTPIARIFTVGGNSFYIDSSTVALPINSRIAVKIPVFTNYPFEKLKNKGADSILLQQIKQLSMFISGDSLWNSQIEQIEITPSRSFEMTPLIGNHLIEFGDGNDIEKKFNRLFVFYKSVLSKTGFDKYARIDISYSGQVIATKKGGASNRADSLQTIKNIEQLISAARTIRQDTAHMQQMRPLEQNAEAEQTLENTDLLPENEDSVTVNSRQPMSNTMAKAVSKPNLENKKKPTGKKPSNLKKPNPNNLGNKQKPKALMPPKK